MTNEEIIKANLSITDSLKALFHLNDIYLLLDAAREDEAGKWEAQLKSEREMSKKLLDALEGLMKGVAGLPPLTAIAGVLEQQYLAGEIAINEYNNKP